MIKITYVIVISLVICILNKINSEVYSSIVKIELLLKTQQSLIDGLETFVKTNNITNPFVINHLKRFKIEQEVALVDPSKYLGNPINCYRLIKRLTVDLKLIKNVLSDFEVDQAVIYPTQHDLQGAAEGLLRLDNVYGLNKAQLAKGLWNTCLAKSANGCTESFNSMTIGDCYELGKTLNQKRYYSTGIEWLNEALKKYSYEWHRYPEDYKITVDDINKHITIGNKGFHNMIKKFTLWYEELSQLIPDIEKTFPDIIVGCFWNDLKPKDAIECIERENRVVSSLAMNSSFTGMNDTYISLCREQMIYGEKKIKGDICYYAHGPHPFLKLAPFKVERLHRDPVIMLFHDAVNDGEIQVIKTLAQHTLERGTVSYLDKKTSARVCQVGRVKNNDSIVAARLRTRVSQFTGMDLDSSEHLQVINYGVGGHYSPHFDYWSEDVAFKEGNRIATVVVFMSDVDQGGATVFPKLGISVHPMKGAALFWHNLLPSGQGNPFTYHASCPVLRGSKWILSQWINIRGQELKLPCMLDRKFKYYAQKVQNNSY